MLWSSSPGSGPSPLFQGRPKEHSAGFVYFPSPTAVAALFLGRGDQCKPRRPEQKGVYGSLTGLSGLAHAGSAREKWQHSGERRLALML